MHSEKVVLKFPPHIVREPIVYHLIKDYDLRVSIMRASINPDEAVAAGACLAGAVTVSCVEHELDLALAESQHLRQCGQRDSGRRSQRAAILDRAGIAGATVSTMSARIGDGRSTLLDGFLSEVNQTAYRLGGRQGTSALAFALAVAEKSP